MQRRCPICRQEATWEDNPSRPFCSDRCKMIDLGHWASEDYRVPTGEKATGAGSESSELDLELDHESLSDESI